jgi:uncharacterized protein
VLVSWYWLLDAGCNAQSSELRALDTTPRNKLNAINDKRKHICIFSSYNVNLHEKGMDRLISDNIDKIRRLCVMHNVRSLFAFGSVCTEKFNEKSDIDLLISFKPMDYGDYADTYFELAEKFENLFHKHVDLITDKSLSNPYFIEAVNKTKTLLYNE